MMAEENCGAWEVRDTMFVPEELMVLDMWTYVEWVELVQWVGVVIGCVHAQNLPFIALVSETEV